MRTIGALLAATIGMVPLGAQTSPTHPTDASSFEVGETLMYDVKFGFVTLGRGMMHIAGVDTVRGVPSLHTIFLIQGGGMIYRLHTRMDSWIGIEDFASRRFIQDKHEGGNHYYDFYDIFPDSGYYRQEGIDSITPASPNPLDDLAFFYFARTVDLELGETYEYENYFRPDRNPVILEVVERDTLDLPAGRFPSIVVHPVIQGRGILAEDAGARLWLSDDERRLIVQLKIKFSFGTITMRLKELPDKPPSEMLQRLPGEG